MGPREETFLMEETVREDTILKVQGETVNTLGVDISDPKEGPESVPSPSVWESRQSPPCKGTYLQAQCLQEIAVWHT